MPTVPIESWQDALLAAWASFVAAIPAVIAALLILLIGWVISNILARIAEEVFERLGADRLYAEHGGQQIYGDAGWRFTPSDVAATVVKWVIRIVALVAAANVLGLTQVSLLLNQVILWIPNLVVAAIILLVAPLIGRFLRGLIEVGAGQMGFSNAPFLGRIAEIAVIAFAVVIAINQIGIAANLVNILFIGIVAAISLAFGLAFGLGGRDVAAEITRGWYQTSRQAADRVRVATSAGAAGGRAGRASATAPRTRRTTPASSPANQPTSVVRAPRRRLPRALPPG
ncbi:MAG TPA: hypothetical protein VGQ47_04010 [Candidatus Limnocylindrales bacterium]|jgi:hypothetical protein|nr:hypothetical protein [Candidatus Limnocylindrales bacterium]